MSDQSIAAPFSADPVAAYIASLRSRHSRRAIAGRLRMAARMMLARDDATVRDIPWTALRFHHLAALQAELVRRGYAGNTVNLTIVACRGVLRAAMRMGLISRDVLANAVEGHRPEPASASATAAGRLISREEIAALFEAARRSDSPSMSARNVAMLAVGLGAGLRRNEIVSLEVHDVELDTGAVHVRCGKGRKPRTVFLPTSAVAAMRRWLAARGSAPGALFCAEWRIVCRDRRAADSDHEPIRPLSDQMVTWTLDKLCALAGVASASPHDLRRTFASMMLDAGVDLVLLQRMMGHVTPLTTARYDRRGNAALVDAAARIDLPIGPEPAQPCRSRGGKTR